MLPNEALFGIEVDLICSRPVDSTDSSLGSSETVDDTRGIIPAEHNLSVEENRKIKLMVNNCGLIVCVFIFQNLPNPFGR